MLVTLAGSLDDRESGGPLEWDQYVRDSNAASFESEGLAIVVYVCDVQR